MFFRLFKQKRRAFGPPLYFDGCRVKPRSKLNTAISCVTPPSAELVALGEVPAALASADMLATKVLKLPPQRAA
jgi:hypothetical protein